MSEMRNEPNSDRDSILVHSGASDGAQSAQGQGSVVAQLLAAAWKGDSSLPAHWPTNWMPTILQRVEQAVEA